MRHRQSARLTGIRQGRREVMLHHMHPAARPWRYAGYRGRRAISAVVEQQEQCHIESVGGSIKCPKARTDQLDLVIDRDRNDDARWYASSVALLTLGQAVIRAIVGRRALLPGGRVDPHARLGGGAMHGSFVVSRFSHDGEALFCGW